MGDLLDMQPGELLVLVPTPDVSTLVEAFSAGAQMRLMPRALEWGKSGDSAFEQVQAAGKAGDTLRADLAAGRVRTLLSDAEVKTTTLALYRAGRRSLKSCATPGIFLALGALRWREAAGSVHYSPLALVPLDVSHESVKAGYTFIAREERALANAPLLAMLRDRAGVSVEDLAPALEDVHGVDAASVLAAFERALADASSLEDSGLVECSVVGIAAIGAFDPLELAGGFDQDAGAAQEQWMRPQKPQEDEAPEGKSPEAQEVAAPLMPFVLNVEQRRAVELACEGSDVVVCGAPGTGRTQTIGGIVAALLGQGKHALVVSNSAAALDAAWKRLAGLGIGARVLRLFGDNTQRPRLLAQLRGAVEPSARAYGDYTGALETCERLASELDAHVADLARTNRAGLSLREQICRFRAFENAPACIEVPHELAEAIEGKEGLTERFSLVERLAGCARRVGDPGAHPLRRVGGTSSSVPGDEMVTRLDTLGEVIDRMMSAQEEVTRTSGIPAARDERDWSRLATIANLLHQWWPLPASWRSIPDVDGLLTRIGYLLSEYDRFTSDTVEFSAQWVPSFFTDLDANELQTQWQHARSLGPLARRRATREIVDRVASYAITDFREESMPRAIAALRQRAADARQLSADEAALAPQLTTMVQAGQRDWSALHKVHRYAVELAQTTAQTLEREGIDPAVFATARQRAAADENVARAIAEALAAHERYLEARKPVVEILGEPLPQAGETIAQAERANCDEVPAHLDLLPDWFAWRDAVRAAEGAGLGEVADALERGLAADEALPAYKRALYLTMCSDSIAASPAARAYSGTVADATVDEYRAADRRLRAAAVSELQNRVNESLPHLAKLISDDREAACAVRAIRGEDTRLGAAELVASMPHLFTRIFPCVLASPAAVLEIAHAAPQMFAAFDVVVFDEAQTLPAEALASFGDSSVRVVVGDPCDVRAHPSRSALDAAMAGEAPCIALSCDYLPAHEGLIAYASRAFFGGDLVGAPSADDPVPPVTLQAVAGVCAQDGSNRAEAETVVGELRRRYNAQRRERAALGLDEHEVVSPSICVIALGESQRDLIEDLLEEACRTDEAFERWVRSAREPLEVTVAARAQSLERDLVVVSCTCAPDARGSLVFGALDQEMGWRLVYAACVHARREMVVVSSLAASDIDDTSGSLGPLALKGLLASLEGWSDMPRAPEALRAPWRHAQERAESTGAALNARGDTQKTSQVVGDNAEAAVQQDVIAQQLAGALEMAGYTIVCGVGTGPCRVDVGVLDSADPQRFLVGFLTDGTTFMACTDTRDRELAVSERLRELGWRTMRIWAFDWWANPEAALRRAFAFIDEAVASGPLPIGEASADASALSQVSVSAELFEEHYDLSRWRALDLSILDAPHATSELETPAPAQSPEPMTGQSVQVEEPSSLLQLNLMVDDDLEEPPSKKPKTDEGSAASTFSEMSNLPAFMRAEVAQEQVSAQEDTEDTNQGASPQVQASAEETEQSLCGGDAKEKNEEGSKAL